VAIARDAEGQEIVRARQLVNVARPQAEVRILLERDKKGRPRSARVIAHQVGVDAVEALRVSFDGEPLELDELNRVRLPEFDLYRAHLLSAQLGGDGGVDARADVVFGGGEGAEVRTELTAVPLLRDADGENPDAAALSGLVLVAGEPVPVAAVETPGRRVFAVTAKKARPGLLKMARELEQKGAISRRSDSLAPQELGPGDDRLFLVVPEARRHRSSDVSLALFPVHGPYAVDSGELPWLLTHLVPRDVIVERLADAVAVAGVRAAAGANPRAVVVLLSDDVEDYSGQETDAVRAFLSALRVPLYVWSTTPDITELPAWGAVRDVSTRKRMRRAAAELEDFLGHQIIVWVEGRHLPHTITLDSKVEGLTLVE
jgi:hypothetical protein